VAARPAGNYVDAVPTTSPTAFTDRFGWLLNVFTFGLPSDRLFGRIADLAAAVEATVFDTLWLPDHVVQGPVGDVDGERSPHTPIPDALTMLGALAAITSRVRVGPLVSPVTIRHPATLAKSTTTIDVVSGGRAVLGIGAGWDADEHRRYGLDFPGPGERVSRLADAVPICRAMFDHEAASHSGAHGSIEEAVNLPQPVGRIPILVGGAGRRTLRVAAAHADACNPIGTTDELRAAFDTVERHCDDLGRDPAHVAKQAGVMFRRVDDLDGQVEAAFHAGADGVILVPWKLVFGPDEVHAIGERLRKEFA
jgi:alkanesulfonate monooxygenase SsuD/methylene tetrahydromethanopterin reductase-like flavin-dependent oxidoreductase (luciferase family)